MNNNAYMDIRIIGKSVIGDLTPDNYDISQIVLMLQNVEDLLYPNQKNERPNISYDLQKGSVLHRFSTTAQCIIGFAAILGQVSQSGSIDFMELKSAVALENIQKLADKTDYTFLFSTSLNSDVILKIDPMTAFQRTEAPWVEAEFYFYGTVKNAGGKEIVNIHLDTDDYGYLKIAVEQENLKSWHDNPLYKPLGVRASGKQNVLTGEIDKNTLILTEIVDYEAKFEDGYLSQLIKKAKGNWKGINAEQWLHEVRGAYNE